MSAQEIRAGDRIRLAREGVVSDVVGSGWVRFEGGELYTLDLYPDIEILGRKVEPLKPGTVLRDVWHTWIITTDGVKLLKPDGEFRDTLAVTPESLARDVADPDDSLRILE